MNNDQVADLVRSYFKYYMTMDRSAMEAQLADDFTFTSPYDDHIDRAAYFERCWPNAGTLVYHDIKTIAVDGEQCFVVYEGKAKNGNAFRNTELMRIVDGRLRSVEVFFGRPNESAEAAASA